MSAGVSKFQVLAACETKLVLGLVHGVELQYCCRNDLSHDKLVPHLLAIALKDAERGPSFPEKPLSHIRSIVRTLYDMNEAQLYS